MALTYKMSITSPPSGTMRSLIAPRYCTPSHYEVAELPIPTIRNPNEVLIKIVAAAISTGDTQIANGMLKMLFTPPMPMRLGAEGAGVVVGVGSTVKRFRVGDEVYGTYIKKPLDPTAFSPGFCSEYAISEEDLLIHKPPTLTFEEAASLPGSAITAYQCFRRAFQLMGTDQTLEGKTVFIPGALSATGSIGIQMAKSVYGAKKLITTVSTAKVPLVDQYLPGVVDEVIDYKKEKVVAKVGKGTVDFAYNTQWIIDSVFPIMNPQSGVIISIASVPTAETMRSVIGKIPFWAGWMLGLVQLWYTWRLLGTNIKMEFISGTPSAREDFERVGEFIALGKIKPVITVVKLDDLEAVRRGCEMVNTGKGGLGKLVIQI